MAGNATEQEVQSPRASEVLDALGNNEKASIGIPHPEAAMEGEVRAEWISVSPLLVSQSKRSAVVRQLGATGGDSAEVRVFQLTAPEGEEHLEVYHITERYGSTFLGNLLEFQVSD